MDALQPTTGDSREPTPERDADAGLAHAEATISRRTLSMIDESIANLRAGVVGEPIDADAILRAMGDD